MNWIFPAIKTTRSVDEQFQKIYDECLEYKEAEGLEKDKEAVDILHSVETFLRIRFKGREDELNNLIQKTIKKNSNRGYYNKDCF